MSVLASKRKMSQLQVYETAVQLRRDISLEMLRNFNYNRLSKQKKEDGTELYPKDIIENYRGRILDILFNITACVAKANAVYPTTKAEVERRIELQNRLIEECTLLQTELNCIVEVFTGVTQFFLPFVDTLDKLIAQTKKWKKSSKHFLDKVVD